MQEKKRFEGALDDAVASGMNAGVEVLMNQVSELTILGLLCIILIASMLLRSNILFKHELSRENIVLRRVVSLNWGPPRLVWTLYSVWKCIADS